jgi:flagellar protein FlgJ
MQPKIPIPAQVLTASSSAEAYTQRTLTVERDPELRKACAEFESVFINQLLKTMRKGIPEGGLLDGGYREEMYTSLLDEQVARKIAHGQGIGLGEQLYRQLSRASEQTETPRATGPEARIRGGKP